MFWVLDSFCSSSLSRTRPEGWNTIKTLKFSFSYIKKQTERIHHWCIIRLKSGIGLFRCSVLNIQDFDLIIFYSVFSTLPVDRIIRYNNDLMTAWGVRTVRWPIDLLRCYFLFCSHHHISSHHGPAWAQQPRVTVKCKHMKKFHLDPKIKWLPLQLKDTLKMNLYPYSRDPKG